MLRKFVHLSLIIAIVVGAPFDLDDSQKNVTKNINIKQLLRPMCQPFCDTGTKYKMTPMNASPELVVYSPIGEFRAKRSNIATGQSRSYYGGYGISPAYYTAFDPISVLASLAFLAFLVQSFATLFDRSRSIIPAIVSSRESHYNVTPDPANFIMRALDEWEILNQVENSKKVPSS